MATQRARIAIAFGDCHFPHQSESALAAVRRVVERLRPDVIVGLGDLIDCGAFSTHPPSPGETAGDYEKDLRDCNTLIDDLQKHSPHFVYICGNHEYRIARFAARSTEGAATFNMLAPEVVIPRGRDKRRFTLVPYAGHDEGGS